MSVHDLMAQANATHAHVFTYDSLGQDSADIRRDGSLAALLYGMCCSNKGALPWGLFQMHKSKLHAVCVHWPFRGSAKALTVTHESISLTQASVETKTAFAFFWLTGRLWHVLWGKKRWWWCWGWGGRMWGGGKQKEVPHQTFPLRHAVKQKRFEN